MGVTLNGRREVGFATGTGSVWPPQFLILKMQEGTLLIPSLSLFLFKTLYSIGDCYVSTPAAILHGVGVVRLSPLLFFTITPTKVFTS